MADLLTATWGQTTRKGASWKKKVEYGKRWLVEIVFSAFSMFGEHLYSLKWKNMVQEVRIKVATYNKLVTWGQPKYALEDHVPTNTLIHQILMNACPGKFRSDTIMPHIKCLSLISQVTERRGAKPGCGTTGRQVGTQAPARTCNRGV